MNFIETFKAARRVSTPLIAVQTADPADTMDRILAHGTQPTANSIAPVVAWDCVRGFWTFSKNKLGQAALAQILPANRAADTFKNPVEALVTIAKTSEGRMLLPSDTIVFFLQGHRFLGDPAVSQAVWNLRDLFKNDRHTLVILCPKITLPHELSQDVLVLSEPLPTQQELAAKVTGIYKAAELPAPSQEIISHATDAVCGLAGFPAEQVLAMSINKTGLDMASLWDRKRTQIEQTPGLSVWRGNENFKDVIDCDNVIGFLQSYVSNIGGIVFIDEIEKAMAGASGDTSGVSQEMHGTLLSWMQDKKAKGMLFLGHPGTGKSLLAKCAGTLSGKPVIKFDMSAMKHSHVGESNARLNAAISVVDAVCAGRPLVIATCNKIEALSPELRRRFKAGTFFFDLPSAAGRQSLWQLYSKRFGVTLPKTLGFDDLNWTGAEIENCCELAHDLNASLSQAASYVVPVSKSAPEAIESLRKQATGKFISAAKPGTYRPETQYTQASNLRRLDLEN